jgi:hypothetical protein
VFCQEVPALEVVEHVEALRTGGQAGAQRAADACQRDVGGVGDRAKVVAIAHLIVDQGLDRVRRELEQPQHVLAAVAGSALERELQRMQALERAPEPAEHAHAKQAAHALGGPLRRAKHRPQVRDRVDAGALRDRAHHRAHEADRPHQVVVEGERRRRGPRIAGQSGHARQLRHPRRPAARRGAVGRAHRVGGHERVPPSHDRARGGIARELLVAFAHQAKRVVVVAHPQMQAVLLDSIGRATRRRALAAQTPARLVDRHLVAACVLRSRQLEGRRHARAAASDDRDLHFRGLRRAHAGRPPRRRVRSAS